MKHGITSLASAVMVALVSVSAVAAPGNRVDREEKQTVNAAGKKELTVKNPRGRTVVVGKPGLEDVSLLIKKSAQGRDDREAAELIDRLEIRIDEHGDEVVVETREDGSRDQSIWSFVKGDRRSAWVDYTIEVPLRFSVNVSTASGEIRISNIDGSAEAGAASGSVDVRAIGGDAEITVASGDVEVAEVGGRLEVRATSGSVTVDKVKGSLQMVGTSGDFRATRIGGDAEIRLSSGGLELEGCSGSVDFGASSGGARIIEVTGSISASTSSGDIEVLIVPTKGNAFELSSSSGDVSVHYVPVKDFGFQLDVRTASGSIEGDLPIRVTRVDRRRLQGVVGSGAASLEIETSSGDVMIMERSEAASKSER